MKMAYHANSDGPSFFRPKIDKELLEVYSEGIICLNNCIVNEFSQASFAIAPQVTTFAIFPGVTVRARFISFWFSGHGLLESDSTLLVRALFQT